MNAVNYISKNIINAIIINNQKCYEKNSIATSTKTVYLW